MKPLAGVRVLDLSRILAGPWSSQNLADLGAEVWKIERPGHGDDTRQWGPPWFEGHDGQQVSAYFLSCNRGKESLAIDFSQPEGAELVRSLAGRADVLIENFLPGALARYGLDAPTLRAQFPRLIYCSISGFGQSGSWAQRPGYDAMIQAQGGLMSLTGAIEGPPQKVGVAITDVLTGLYAGTAVLAALYARNHTGEGAHVEVALLDTQVATLANQALNYLVAGQVPPRHGNAHPSIVPYQSFATADGFVMLAVGNDVQFQRFCIAAGLPELAQDPRFRRNADRVQSREPLVTQIQSRLSQRSTADWLTAFEQHEVPAGPINDLEAVFALAPVRERQLAFTLTHPVWGEVPQVRGPIRCNGSVASAELAPPTLGQHTAVVLQRELGLTTEAVLELRRSGVIA